MELHIGELTSEVELGGPASQMAPDQIEDIVRLVIARLDQRERDRQRRAETVAIEPAGMSRSRWW
jgi:hypothetical protein